MKVLYSVLHVCVLCTQNDNSCVAFTRPSTNEIRNMKSTKLSLMVGKVG